MWKQNCACASQFFDVAIGICRWCGKTGLPVQAGPQAQNGIWQSNCQHGASYFDPVLRRCLVCGTPGVLVPQQGNPMGGPFPPVPQGWPLPPPPMPNQIGGLQALVSSPARSVPQTKVQVLEKMEPPKPTEEELLQRANDAFPVLTAKELLCHRCCVIMRPRISLTTVHEELFQVAVTCHGVTSNLLIGWQADKTMVRNLIGVMLQDIQEKTKDDWTF